MGQGFVLVCDIVELLTKLQFYDSAMAMYDKFHGLLIFSLNITHMSL